MGAMNNKKIKQAVILAGGQGMRLRPLTNDRPKPMVLVNGRPFLEYLIDLVRRNGINEVIILLGYLPEKITEHFSDGSKFGIKIKYSITDVADKNGTRIKKAKHLFDDHFLLLFGDMYSPKMDLAKMLDFYSQMNLPAMMTVYDNHDERGEYGTKSNVDVSPDGYVTYYAGFCDDLSFKGLDIGSFIFNKKVIDIMPDSDFSLQAEFLPQLIKRRELAGYIVRDDYHTITTPELVERVKQTFIYEKVN